MKLPSLSLSTSHLFSIIFEVVPTNKLHGIINDWHIVK